jgi:hypothetical protein
MNFNELNHTLSAPSLDRDRDDSIINELALKCFANSNAKLLPIGPVAPVTITTDFFSEKFIFNVGEYILRKLVDTKCCSLG